MLGGVGLSRTHLTRGCNVRQLFVMVRVQPFHAFIDLARAGRDGKIQDREEMHISCYVFPVKISYAMFWLIVPAVASSVGTTVQTEYGPVVGVSTASGMYWKGIPYAEPPMGANRWMPTKRIAQPWTTPRAASKFGEGTTHAASLHTLRTHTRAHLNPRLRLG